MSAREKIDWTPYDDYEQVRAALTSASAVADRHALAKASVVDGPLVVTCGCGNEFSAMETWADHAQSILIEHVELLASLAPRYLTREKQGP